MQAVNATPSAVVFDLDGLLIDSEQWAWQAHNEVLAQLGCAPLSLDEVRTLVGLDSEHEWSRLRAMRHLAISHAAYVQEQGVAFRRLRAALLAPMPGAVALIEWLRDRGVPVAVASNSPRRSVEAALSELALLPLFAALASIDDVVTGKPAPDVYLHALRGLGADPAFSVAFEDSPVGVTAARAAGLLVAAVPNDLTAAFDFSHADAVLPSLTHAPRWLCEVVPTLPPRVRQ